MRWVFSGPETLGEIGVIEVGGVFTLDSTWSDELMVNLRKRFARSDNIFIICESAQKCARRALW